jgi:hypothetical protein
MGENCLGRRLWVIMFTKNYVGDEIRENLMGGACSTSGGE